MDNKLKIINHLGKNIGKDFTMRELSKETEIPYATFHRTVKSMPELVLKNKKGSSILIEIKKTPVLASYLAVSSEEEKKQFLKKSPIINKIADEIKTKDIVLLFGSYAKYSHTDKSDIDILVISKDGNKTLSFSKYELLFKKQINPVFVKKKEFIEMLNSAEENIAKQALENHILLNNPQEFWELVINGV